VSSVEFRTGTLRQLPVGCGDVALLDDRCELFVGRGHGRNYRRSQHLDQAPSVNCSLWITNEQGLSSETDNKN
jgi:hypothetical protein